MTITAEKLNWGQKNGVITGATLRADGNAFQVVVQTKEGEHTLVTTRTRKVRLFSSPIPALRLLHKAGVLNAKIDLTQWTPRQDRDAPFDPVKSERAKERHASGKRVKNTAAQHGVGAGNMPSEQTPGEAHPVSTAPPPAPVTQAPTKPKVPRKTGTPLPSGELGDNFRFD